MTLASEDISELEELEQENSELESENNEDYFSLLIEARSLWKSGKSKSFQLSHTDWKYGKSKSFPHFHFN